jgi:hypothetical protein
MLVNSLRVSADSAQFYRKQAVKAGQKKERVQLEVNHIVVRQTGDYCEETVTILKKLSLF